MPFAPCLDSTISSLPRQLKVARCERLDIICLPQNCGCSSVVERLVANEKVASSTLVTRSSPESFRGWSERAEAMRRRAAAKKPSYGRQASFRNVLRLPSQVGVVSETAIHRFNFQSEAAD
jgi:hypothetical protein